MSCSRCPEARELGLFLAAMLADHPALAARCPPNYYAPAIGLFDLAMRLGA